MIFGQSIHPRRDCLTAMMAGQPLHPREPSLSRPCRPAINQVQLSPALGVPLGPSGFVSAVSVQDIRRLGVWPLASLSSGRATLQSGVSRGHPSREVIKVPVLVRSKLTVSLYWASWAETALALHYSSSVPSNLSIVCCRNHDKWSDSLHTDTHTLTRSHRQTYHICAQHEWQQDKQGGATPDNHLQALAISSCRKVGCSSQRPRPRRRMAALRAYSALQTPNSPGAISQQRIPLRPHLGSPWLPGPGRIPPPGQCGRVCQNRQAASPHQSTCSAQQSSLPEGNLPGELTD